MERFKYGIFISHSGEVEDNTLLQRTRHIIELVGATPLVSIRGDHPGTVVDREVEDMIHRSKGMVALFSRNGCVSPSVNQEVTLAKSQGKNVIPVLLKGQTLPGIFLHGMEPLPIDGDDWDSVLKIAEAIDSKNWNPATPILESLQQIEAASLRGDIPFRCHKGHYPGNNPCDMPVSLQKDDKGRYAMFHVVNKGKNHDWEAVYVSDSMAEFLRRFVLR